jgi:hypothetical protein
MGKNIEFIPMNKDVDIKLPTPQSAKSYIPEWYKNATNFIGDKMTMGDNGLNKDLKLCSPFMDSFLTGYIISTWCDIIVSKNDQGITEFRWTEEPQPIVNRNPQMAKTLPRPSGHSNSLYAWNVKWGTKTPNGYSAIFTHPLNRFDLPFTTTSGVMDTDMYSMGGEIPFFLKQDFEGIIPEGTPIVQIIPIKRDSWESIRSKYDDRFVKNSLYQIGKTLYGGYKKLFWQKKSYN